jgi:hypothetical protein
LSEYKHDGSPTWLAAYPNDGTYDWFGLRFYRQALRFLLVRGAAANSFNTAKTLIYYGAVAQSFRMQHGLDEVEPLSKSQLNDWKSYYQVANYLYVVPRQAREASSIGGGFIGAATEYDEHFKSFDLSDKGEYDIRAAFDRIYPSQRQWGYLAQFWLPPIKYFRCVLDIEACATGEYAIHCYNTLANESGWKTFVSVLKKGSIDKEELSTIHPIIDSHTLSGSEKEVAQHIIFDKYQVNPSENLEYQKCFNLLLSLKQDGLEGFIPDTQEDYAMMFSYAHLANIELGQSDPNWKMLMTSVTFDIGISRLYTWLGQQAVGEVIDEIRLDNKLLTWVHEWLKQNGFSGSMKEVIDQWKAKYLGSINNYESLFIQMLDYDVLDTAFDGIIQGIIVSGLPFDEKTQESDHYQRITDVYHRFAPKRYFKDHPVDVEQSFDEFFLKFTKALIINQYKFGLERMGMGQKAKQILNFYEDQNQYVYQVDDRKFYENRGIYDMIGATVSTWESAGIF